MKNDFIKNKLDTKNKPKNASKKDKKKIATIILTILMLFWSLGSIFGFIGGIKSVSAESFKDDITFNGSNVLVPINYHANSSDTFVYTYYYDLKITLSFISDLIVFDTTDINYSFKPGTNVNLTIPFNYAPGMPAEPDIHGNFIELNYILEINSSFNSNITGVRLGHNDRSVNNSVFYFNYIEYFSSNGGSCKLSIQSSNLTAFQVNSLFGSLPWLDSRTYYLSTNIDSSSADYQQGYLDGENSGYDEGYKNGKLVGYEDGFNNGVASAGDYTFISLLGAVIDAPIQALNGFLNFELLGFNMFNFVSALFTLCLIIVVVKLFI